MWFFKKPMFQEIATPISVLIIKTPSTPIYWVVYHVLNKPHVMLTGSCDTKSMGLGTLLPMGTLGQQEEKGHAQSDTVEVPRLSGSQTHHWSLRYDLGHQRTWGWHPLCHWALQPLAASFISLPWPLLPHLYNGSNNSTCFIWWLVKVPSRVKASRKAPGTE